MKTLTKYAIYYVFVFLVFIANMFFYVKDNFYYSLADLPVGEVICRSMSPGGMHSAVVYKIETPKGDAVRVELVSINFNDEENVSSTSKNIYWEVGKSAVTIGWENANTLIIDSHTLDISKGDTYDSRIITKE